MNRFLNKHVVVTGGARGIGFEIAKQFLVEGARVSVLDNNANNLSNAKGQLSPQDDQLNTYVVDVSVFSEVENAINQAEAVQPVDILINNAGVAMETPFLKIDENEWRKVIDINLTGVFFVAQAVCRKMVARKRGVVVNMSSKNGLDGEVGYAHYNSTKAGVIMLTKTMALELAHQGIRVNAVCPGYIQTPMSMEIDSPEFVNEFTSRYIPMNRAGRADEIAPLFLFLSSDESSFITGQTFIADGGQLSGQKPWNDLLGKFS